MNSIILEISLVLVLLLANGLCAMTEIAIVSSRKGLLRGMASSGNAGAAKALALSESPNRFLSTVQIGITLVGIVAGALGSGKVAARLAEVLAPLPFVGNYAAPLSLALVITLLTYLSLVIGELVPKRLAMKFPEAIASAMAAPMSALSTAASPAVSLLSWSTGGLLRLFGIREEDSSEMSRDELTVLVRQGMVAGSINRTESRMMEGVINFEKLVTYDIMIPRTRFTWIEQSAPHDSVSKAVMTSTHDVFPVYQDRRDNLVGVVSIKDIYGQLSSGETVSLEKIMQPPLLVPEMQKASKLLEEFRRTGQRAAFVIDEFGSVMGMVTLIDLIETIIGDVPSREEQLAMPIQKREDGSWLIDGLFEIEKLSQHLDGFDLPEGGGDEYQTITGWFLRELERMPKETDRIHSGEWTFEVIDMDGIRLDKVLATRNGDQVPERAL
jgi:putative hemolysin